MRALPIALATLASSPAAVHAQEPSPILRTANDSLAYTLLVEARAILAAVTARVTTREGETTDEEANYLDLAEQLMRLGAVSDAYAVASGFDSIGYTVTRLARRQAWTGDLDGAIGNIRLFVPPEKARLDVATLLGAYGRFDDAIAVAEGANAGLRRGEILTRIAFSTRDSTKARTILRRASEHVWADPVHEPRELLNIAYLRVRFGDAEALRTLFPDTLSQAETSNRLWWMVQWSRPNNDWLPRDSLARASLAAASQIEGARARNATLSRLITALAAAGGPLRGTDALMYAPTGRDTVLALAQVVRDELHRSPPDLGSASAAIEASASHGLRPRFDVLLAAARAASGQAVLDAAPVVREYIDQWLEKAAGIAESLSGWPIRDSLLLAVVKEAIRTDHERAERTARAIEADSLSGYALAQVGRSLAIRDPAGALRLWRSVRRSVHKDQILASIIQGIPANRSSRTFDMDRGESMARQIRHPEARPKALLLIAREWGALGRRDRATALAQEVLSDPPESDPDFAQCGLEILVRMGALQDALGWARGRITPNARANALIEVAEALEPIDVEFWTSDGGAAVDAWCDHWGLDDLDFWRTMRATA